MDEEQRLDIALFRYRIIAPLLDPDLTPRLAQEYRRRITTESHSIPCTDRTRIAPRTLRLWVQHYRERGFEGLKPRPRSDREAPRALRPEVLDAAVAHRKALPERSIPELITLLESTGVARPGEVKPSTLARWLQVLEVTSRDLKRQTAPPRRRFEQPRRNALWQGDVMYGPHLPDPADPARKRRTYLVGWIDDYSRLCPHASFYWAEHLPALEDSLCRAILRYGLPERLYVDNGKIYSARQFERICAELGIRTSHAAPYHPEGKGKIERFHRTVREGFLKEARHLKLETLEDLNRLFWAWLEEAYHHRVHTATGQRPAERFAHGPGTLRRPEPTELEHIFLWQEERVVDKTSCVALLGNCYEVDAQLRGRRVELRFNPYDLTRIQVHYRDRDHGLARPVDLQRTVDARVGDTPTRPTPEAAPLVSYLAALEERHQKRLRQALQGTPFARLLQPEEDQPTDEKGGRSTDV
jgi:transposase InsO family protein